MLCLSALADDTTGQEEVFVWLSRFNFTEQANSTLNAVLAYMRLIPNWAWHGGARSMGDLGKRDSKMRRRVNRPSIPCS